MHNDGRWPGHPRLLPEESFSSWFSRTAAANGLRVASDLDRYADLMAEHTGRGDTDDMLFRKPAALHSSVSVRPPPR
jgi:hypothetical protein